MRIYRIRLAAEKEASARAMLDGGAQEIYTRRGLEWVVIPQTRSETLDDLLPGGEKAWKLQKVTRATEGRLQ